MEIIKKMESLIDLEVDAKQLKGKTIVNVDAWYKLSGEIVVRIQTEEALICEDGSKSYEYGIYHEMKEGYVDEICDYILKHYDSITVREQVDGKWGAFYLSELPIELALKNALRLIKERRIPHRLVDE